MMRSVIVAGYTPFTRDRRYELIKEIVKNLNDADTFSNVDLLPEAERVGREDVFDQWRAFLEGFEDKSYTEFTLRVPFATPDINLALVREDQE